jgi:hypothetical protein
MHIASEHIQEWIRTGKGLVVPVEIAIRFGQYLNGLPWLASGTGLDWSRIKGKKVMLCTLNEGQRASWLASIPIGGDPYLAFWYEPDEPCVACESAFAFSNFDQAFWKAPGRRYVFGGSIRDGTFEPNFIHFAEYDGADILVAAQ